MSALVHAGALAATLIAFSSNEKLDDVQETVPVEVITDNQFNEIMKGDKAAKEVQPDAAAPQEQAAAPEAAPPPPPPPPPPPEPTPVAPPPPPPPQQAEQEPPPPPTPVPPPRPAPPPEPAATPPVPTPPVRVADAEPVLPKPVPKPAPKPPVVPRPQVVKHDIKPPPPPPPKPHPVDKPKPDVIAKLIADPPPDEAPVPAPKPSIRKPKPPVPTPAATAPQAPSPESKFDLTDITKMLFGHDSQPAKPAGATASHDLRQVASLGSPTASAAKMSPSFWAGLDGLLEDQYRGCWSYLGLSAGTKYIPQVRVVYGLDGSLQGSPVLLNPPSDPALQSLADSAMRAVRRCNPLKIPEQYAPYYEQWKGRVLRFDPEEMAG